MYLRKVLFILPDELVLRLVVIDHLFLLLALLLFGNMLEHDTVVQGLAERILCHCFGVVVDDVLVNEV